MQKQEHGRGIDTHGTVRHHLPRRAQKRWARQSGRTRVSECLLRQRERGARSKTLSGDGFSGQAQADTAQDRVLVRSGHRRRRRTEKELEGGDVARVDR